MERRGGRHCREPHRSRGDNKSNMRGYIGGFAPYADFWVLFVRTEGTPGHGGGASIKSGVLHDHALHRVGGVLAGVHALLQVDIDLPPADDGERVPAGGVEVAHPGDEQPVRLLLQGVDVDDVGVEGLGPAEVGELLQQGVQLLAAAEGYPYHIQGMALIPISEPTRPLRYS